MTDLEDVHDHCVVVEAVDHSVVPSAGRPSSVQLSPQRLTPPARVSREAAEDELDERIGDPRWPRRQTSQRGSREHHAVFAHPRGGNPRDSRACASSKVRPAAISASASARSCAMPGCESQNSVSCNDCHSSAATITTAGRPLRVMVNCSCSRSARSAYSDRCDFRSDSEVTSMRPMTDPNLGRDQIGIQPAVAHTGPTKLTA
jgi:hypothetical protein